MDYHIIIQALAAIPTPLTSLKSLEAAIYLKGDRRVEAFLNLPMSVINVNEHSSIVVSLGE